MIAPLLVENPDLATLGGTAHGTLVSLPLSGVDEGVARGFGTGVHFLENRPPPLDHLLLNRDRARCREMDRTAQRRQIVARLDLRRELQHAYQHGRYKHAVRGAIMFNRREGLLGVELAKADDRTAEALHADHEAAWRRVIKRPRVDQHGIGVKTVVTAQHGEPTCWHFRRFIWQRPAHSLWPPGGTGRIEHRRPTSTMGQWYGCLAFKQRLIRLKTANDAVDHKTMKVRTASGSNSHGSGGERQRTDQQLRITVVDDIGRVIDAGLAADTGVGDPGILCCPAQLRVAHVVLEKNGDGVALNQT